MRTPLPVLLAAAACAAPTSRPVLSTFASPALPARHPEAPALDAGLLRREAVYVGAARLPWVTIGPDEDPDEPGGGILYDPDLAWGDGRGLEVGWRQDTTGLGLFWLESEHRTSTTREEARARAGFLELRAFGSARGRDVALWATLGAGAGWLDLELFGPTPDSCGTALELRAAGGALLFGHLALELGGGVFSWGVPGETLGEGGFLSASVALHL